MAPAPGDGQLISLHGGEDGATGIRTANNSFCGGDITGLISAEIWLFLTVWVHVTPQICRLLATVASSPPIDKS